MDFDYVAISGGGTKGVFAVGVVLALDYLGLLTNIKGIVGTSIGGLIGTMYILGFTGNEIANYASDTQFSTLLQRPDPIRFISRGYICNGKLIKQKLKELIFEKTQNENITLGELYIKTGKHLILTAVCREDSQLALLDHTSDTFSDLPLWRALRMTMSFPYVFKPEKWKEKHYIDGGCRLNYPITVFPIEKTLGIRIGVRGHRSSMLPFSVENPSSKLSKNHPLTGFIYNLYSMLELLIVVINAISEEAEIQALKGLKFREIDGLIENTSTLSFDVSHEDKVKMIMHGISRAIECLVDPQWKTV